LKRDLEDEERRKLKVEIAKQCGYQLEVYFKKEKQKEKEKDSNSTSQAAIEILHMKINLLTERVIQLEDKLESEKGLRSCNQTISFNTEPFEDGKEVNSTLLYKQGEHKPYRLVCNDESLDVPKRYGKLQLSNWKFACDKCYKDRLSYLMLEDHGTYSREADELRFPYLRNEEEWKRYRIKDFGCDGLRRRKLEWYGAKINEDVNKRNKTQREIVDWRHFYERNRTWKEVEF